MNETELPDELVSIEQQLARAALRLEPSSGFCQRVLAAGKSASGLVAAAKTQPSVWQFAATAAVVALVWMNLSMSAANHTAWDFGPGAEPLDVRATADQLRAILPTLSEREARREAVMLLIGGQSLRAPSAPLPVYHGSIFRESLGGSADGLRIDVD